MEVQTFSNAKHTVKLCTNTYKENVHLVQWIGIYMRYK